MESPEFSQQIETTRSRVQNLFRSADPGIRQLHIVQQAFDELYGTLSLLESAQQDLVQSKSQLEDLAASIVEEQQRYQALLDSMPDGYLVTGVDGTIRQANRAASDIMRCAPRSLIGRHLAIFLAEGERRAFRSKLRAIETADGTQSWETRFQANDGTWLNVELAVNVAVDRRGRPTCFHWRISDISNSRKTLLANIAPQAAKASVSKST